MNSKIIISFIVIVVLIIVYNFCIKEQEIPKIIWTYWDNKDLPQTVQYCISTWKYHNPDWEIRLINNENIKHYLPSINMSDYKFIDSHARKSDIIRCLLLAEYGGVWCDASIIMNDSLQYLLDIQKEKGCEFVGYYLEKFTTNYDFPVIESWFFACVPDCKFMKRWRDMFLLINDYNNIDDYVNYIQLKTDIQNIDAPHYLAIHLAAQYVLQNEMTVKEIKDQLYLLKAEDGPFKYLVNYDWANEPAVKSLCTNKERQTPLNKLRGCERSVIEEDLKKYACIFK